MLKKTFSERNAPRHRGKAEGTGTERKGADTYTYRKKERERGKVIITLAREEVKII